MQGLYFIDFSWISAWANLYYARHFLLITACLQMFCTAMPLTDLTWMGYTLPYCVCSSLVCHPSLVSVEQLVMSVKSLLQTCKQFVSFCHIKTRKKAAKSMTSDLFRLSRQKRCLFQIAKRSHSLRDWNNFFPYGIIVLSNFGR